MLVNAGLSDDDLNIDLMKLQDTHTQDTGWMADVTDTEESERCTATGEKEGNLSQQTSQSDGWLY